MKNLKQIENNPVPEFLTHKEAIERFKLSNYSPLDRVEVSVVMVMDGETHIQENLDSWYEREVEKHSNFDGTLMVVINGNLKVNGIAIGNEDYNAHLLVLGDLNCNILRSCDEVSWITGNAYVKYVFDGNYNDGSIVIKGVLNTPYLLNSDHSSDVTTSDECISICYHGDDGFFNYDITEEDFEENLIFLPKIYKDGDFDRDAFYQVIKSGHSPFVEGYKINKS